MWNYVTRNVQLKLKLCHTAKMCGESFGMSIFLCDGCKEIYQRINSLALWKFQICTLTVFLFNAVQILETVHSDEQKWSFEFTQFSSKAL